MAADSFMMSARSSAIVFVARIALIKDLSGPMAILNWRNERGRVRAEKVSVEVESREYENGMSRAQNEEIELWFRNLETSRV